MTSIDDLRASLDGMLLQPGDDGYQTASSTHYTKGEPALIVVAASTADVVAAVRYATTTGLRLSVKGGGHGTSGAATNTGGLVIDLSGLDSIEIEEPDAARVRIGGGATWGAIASTLGEHGLALTSGDTVSVGVGGLTLGGGIGWLVRQYGLALDNLVEAEVVTAAGEIVTANADLHPDLFWALRGGGGNFGVVTSFRFVAHPLDGIVAGTIELDPGQLAATLRGWRDVMRAAPEELNVTLLATPPFGPEMPAALQLHVCYGGSDRAAADAAIAPLLALPGVRGSDLAAKPYRDILVENPGPPPGITIVDSNSFANDFSDELIDALVVVHEGLGAAALMIRSLRGAFNRVPTDATAFAWRDAEVLLVSAVFLPPEAPGDAEAAARASWRGLGELVGGAYGNFMSQDDEAALGLMYPPATRSRLDQVKAAYDPQNLFHGNQALVASTA
jgi:FAD/FMN-containing dehydrogenase